MKRLPLSSSPIHRQNVCWWWWRRTISNIHIFFVGQRYIQKIQTTNDIYDSWHRHTHTHAHIRMWKKSWKLISQFLILSNFFFTLSLQFFHFYLFYIFFSSFHSIFKQKIHSICISTFFTPYLYISFFVSYSFFLRAMCVA